MHIALGFAIALGWALPITPAQDSAKAAIERAAAALGGRAALLGLTTVRYDLTLENSDPSQGSKPAGPDEKDPPIYLRDRRFLDVDYGNARQRTFVDGMIYGNQPFRLVRVDRPDSTVGVNLLLRTAFHFPGGPTRAPLAQLMAESLVRRALAAGDSLKWLGGRREGDRSVAVVELKEPGIPVAQRLIIDQANGRLVGLEADTDDPVLGDVLTRFDYLDYRKAGPLELPHRIVQRRNGTRFQAYVVRSVAIGPSIPDSAFRVPGGFPIDSSQPPALTVSPTGRDLFLVRAAYNSLFLVADDHVVVIEAPVHSRRSMRVLEEIRRVAPGKPIRHVVATHFHTDHIGGLRPFIAEGATIVTTESVRQVVEHQMIPAKRTRNADTLSRSPRPPVFEIVRGKRVLGDARHRVEVIDVSPNPHADEILMVWFPEERLLFEGDMLDLLVPEGQPSMPGDDTRALARTIAKLGLDVDRIIPVHGRAGRMTDLTATLARTDR